MPQFNKKALVITALALGVAFDQTQTSAHAPKDDKGVTTHNLRVLPQNISHEELIATMRHFNVSLGVKCGYCHIELPGQTTAEGHPAMDFASDDKDHKRNARKMMRMTADINEKLDAIGDGEFEHVVCATCHRGLTHPSAGLDSAMLPPKGKK